MKMKMVIKMKICVSECSLLTAYTTHNLKLGDLHFCQMWLFLFTWSDRMRRENYESGIKHPWTSPSLEPSISDDSCLTSNSTTTLTSNGNKQYSSARNMEFLAEEIDLQDSATFVANPIFEITSAAKCSTQWELEYIRELLNYAELVLEDSAFGPTRKIINDDLCDQLEYRSKYMDPFMKVQRKALFYCVSLFLQNTRERTFSGSYKEWSKWSTRFQKKDLLADEIQKELHMKM